VTENFYSVVFSVTDGTPRGRSRRVKKVLEMLGLAAEHFEFGLKRDRGFTQNMWDAWNIFGHSFAQILQRYPFRIFIYLS
jgi:hypothetical protein